LADVGVDESLDEEQEGDNYQGNAKIDPFDLMMTR